MDFEDIFETIVTAIKDINFTHRCFCFILYLSSSCLLLTSLYILMPVKVYHQGPDGLITKQGVFIEPTLEYFGKLHIKYSLLGILMILLFYLLPMFLLFAYPFHCFQRILNKARLNSLVLKHLLIYSKDITKMAQMVQEITELFLCCLLLFLFWSTFLLF